MNLALLLAGMSDSAMGQIVESSGSLVFQNVPFGTTSPPQTETICNGGSAGSAAVPISAVTINPPFKVTSDSCMGTSLVTLCGNSCSTSVTFTPPNSSGLPLPGALRYFSNGTEVASVGLLGSGLAGCQVNFQQSVTSFSAVPLSQDLKPTTMNGIFVPHDLNGNAISLASAATECSFDTAQGFSGFNWQQTVTNLPRPSPYVAVDGTPLVTPFLDPPTPAGYTYDPLGTADLYPFYYGPNSCAFRDAINGCVIPVQLGTTVLNFFDSAPDSCLPGGTGEGCFGLTVPPGPDSDLEFTTTLVGISTTPTAQSAICGPNSSLYCAPLSSWKWKSTFNGTSGGVSKLNDLAPDPNSGTGGVTITSINGVPQTPPIVACMVTPSALWPPNGKSVLVTVSGTIAAGTQTIPVGGTTFSVNDKYGQDQPTGSIAVGTGGSYSFTVPLIAARDGNDLDGRTYSINVIAADAIGNVGSCAAVVAVPHDQGR